MEILALGLFCAGVAGCVAAKLPLAIALGFGLLVFLAYGILRGASPSTLLRAAFTGVRQARVVLVMLLVVGAMTALWRGCGTIPLIIASAYPLVSPHSFLLATFLLTSAMSLLIGTAFGTAATMGVTCAMLGIPAGVDPVLLGGAVLAGCYVGDRTSPVSTSAALVRTLTRTTLGTNVRLMARSAAIPFAITCAIFLVLGLMGTTGELGEGPARALESEFVLSPLALLPAILVVILPLARVGTIPTLLTSTLVAAAIGIGLEGLSLSDVARMSLMGFAGQTTQVASLLDGGGVVSMLNVFAIVAISSTYSGIFHETRLLDRACQPLAAIARRVGSFSAVLAASVFTSMIACNQTLATMLTHQLCDDIDPDKQHLAIALEDTVVVVSPLVPWSIAGAMVLTVVGAPVASVLAAPMLWLLPLFGVVREIHARRAVRVPGHSRARVAGTTLGASR